MRKKAVSILLIVAEQLEGFALREQPAQICRPHIESERRIVLDKYEQLAVGEYIPNTLPLVRRKPSRPPEPGLHAR